MSDDPMADGAGSPQHTSQRCVAALDPRLMLWLSPAFPVGAFAFSHGLEQAAAQGWLGDSKALEAWLRDLAQLGSLRNDLVLSAAAWRAAHTLLTVEAERCGNGGRTYPDECVLPRPADRLQEGAARSSRDGALNLLALNDLALALQPSAERHLETRTQGNAFLATIVAAWPCAGLETIKDALSGPAPVWRAGAEGEANAAGNGSPALRSPSLPGKAEVHDIAYPIAVGAVAAAHGIALDAALTGYALAFAGNLLSAAIRLSVVGQTDGQRVMAALLPDLEAAAISAAACTLDDLGSATFRSDLAQLAHETLYSRLFRS